MQIRRCLGLLVPSRRLLVLTLGAISFIAATTLTTQWSLANVKALETEMRKNPGLTLFVKALDISYFWERLISSDTFTVFVPTDKAMQVEGSDFLMQSVLMTEENVERLAQLVATHVIPGNLPEGKDRVSLQTLSGDCLTIENSGRSLKVGPEAYALNTEQFGNIKVITIDRLLIPDYRPGGGCPSN